MTDVKHIVIDTGSVQEPEKPVYYNRHRFFGVYYEGDYIPSLLGLGLIGDGGYVLIVGPLYVRLRGSRNRARPRLFAKFSQGWWHRLMRREASW